MTKKRFVITAIVLFTIFLISVPFAISSYQSHYHKLDFNVTSISGEFKDGVAHIEINGTVRKRLIDLKKYDEDNYLYGPCEGGEPQMHNIEVSSNSFSINNKRNNFTAYVDIDTLKEFGEEYSAEELKLPISTYVKKRLWLCAVNSKKELYKYGSSSDNAVLYMEDYPDIKIEWK